MGPLRVLYPIPLVNFLSQFRLSIFYTLFHERRHNLRSE